MFALSRPTSSSFWLVFPLTVAARSGSSNGLFLLAPDLSMRYFAPDSKTASELQECWTADNAGLGPDADQSEEQHT